MLASCASFAPGLTSSSAAAPSVDNARAVEFVNRVTWGANAASVGDFRTLGQERFLQRELHPVAGARLPADVEACIAAMSISQQPVAQLVATMEQRRKDADATVGDDEKKAAQQAYQRDLTRVANEAATRSLLRALYSPNQLQEQMTWFWMNHFSVFQYKSNLRVLVGDYEDRAIRPHALGKFHDLLAATVHHAAMLRFLDNEQNAVGRINENYAREIMELHTLGVDGGYSQRDVQELARVLTGLGVNMTDKMPNVRRDLQSQYVRDGLFEFNPNRHDYGDKQFLGATIHGGGMAEVDQVIDRLSRHPATAHYVSRKLAVYFVADNPPDALVDRMARAFLRSDGDIAVTLRTMFDSPEFAASLGTKFKDPVHYVVSAVRLAYPDKSIVNAKPMIYWLNRMGEPLYGRQTPDGYPLGTAAWSSAGQLTARFEIARTIGSGSAGLFKADAPDAVDQPAFPQLANALYYDSLAATLGAETREALDQARSPQEWNMFLLSAPELVYR